MPRKLPTPCSRHGCPKLSHERFCEDHMKQYRKESERDRKNSYQRGYSTSRWRKFRSWYLNLYPLCVKCEEEGRVNPATNVDHIDPVDGPNDPRFFDEAEVQALCHRHHSQKTAVEDGGWGRDR